MYAVSSQSRKKSWQNGRQRVSVLAAMALKQERVVQKLTQLREDHSLTQEQAAGKVGVTLRQWQRWEAGESMPYPRNLDMIASRFGFDPGEFFDADQVVQMNNDNPSQLDKIERCAVENYDLSQRALTAIEGLTATLAQQAVQLKELSDAVSRVERGQARGGSAGTQST